MKLFFIFLFFFYSFNVYSRYGSLDFDETTKNYKTWENHIKYGSSTAEIDKTFLKRKSKNKKFFLYSPDIYDNREILQDQLYNKKGCSGNNNSPKLVWKNPPIGTKSFAITLYDKTANNNTGLWHWIIYNIPANIYKIENGANNKKKLMPKKSKQNINDFGEKKYSGICPNDDNKHTYILTIYAINIEKLDILRNATPAMAISIIRKQMFLLYFLNA